MPATSSRAGTPIAKPIPDWEGLAGGVILAAGALAIYSRTFHVPLLFDDHYAIADNSSIRHWSTAFWPAANQPVSGRPLLNLSLAVNYAISGTAVWSYHALNLAIHVLAGLTLFAIVRRTLRRPVLAGRFGPSANALALAVSALWLWHPVLTESVTYLSQRAESLMGLFYLLTLYCFIRGAETNANGDRRLWFPLSVLACLAGIATKEVIVTAPVLVCLYDRTFISGSFAGAWRRHWPLHVALAATWLALGGLLFSPHHWAVGFGKGVVWWAYGWTECRAVVKYLWLAFWPHPLIFDYGMGVATGLPEVWPYAVVLVALLIITAVALRRSPAAAFTACWFFLILAPTSSIVPVVGQPMAENRLYLPLAGVAAFAVLGTFALVGRRSLALFAVVAAGLGLVAAQRNRDYASGPAIWSDTVAKRPDNERAHYNLGLAWAQIPGRLADAIAQYEAALRLQPDYVEAHNNLGLAWSQTPGRLDDAIAEFEAALRLRPDAAEVHNNLGDAWARMPGRRDDAIAQYEAALRLNPDSAEVHNNLGHAWSQIPGRLDDAIAQYEEALRLQPDFAEAHNNLGVAWAHQPGRMDDAVAQFETALRLQPDYAGAHNNLGLAWSLMPGRLNDAIGQFEEALRLQPGFAPGWHNLGMSWFHLGNLPAAAAAFREELRLSPNDPAARQALAAVLEQARDH